MSFSHHDKIRGLRRGAALFLCTDAESGPFPAILRECHVTPASLHFDSALINHVDPHLGRWRLWQLGVRLWLETG